MYATIRFAVAKFFAHHCTQMAAAIAYYMVFSLPALLLISVTIAGYVARQGELAEENVIEKKIVEEVEQVVGPVSADQVESLIKKTRRMPPSPLSLIVGVALLLLGASGVMAQLQVSLNTIWKVDGESDRIRNRGFLFKRLLSIAFVLVVGLLLLVSLVISTLLATLGDAIVDYLPEQTSLWAPWLLSTTTDLVVAVMLFTAIYKWLPDTRVGWKYAWRGGLLTAVMFVVGKSVLSLFLAKVGVGSAYGAAGSLAVLLAWFYYNALVFLFGAELTHAIESRVHRA